MGEIIELFKQKNIKESDLMKLEDMFEHIDEQQNEIICGRGFAGYEEVNLRKVQKVGLASIACALEGNTYDLIETKVLLEDGLTAAGKPLDDAEEIVGFGKAYGAMLALLDVKPDLELSVDLIKKAHKIAYIDTLGDKAGICRASGYALNTSEYEITRCDIMPGIMDRYVEEIESIFDHTVLQAAYAALKLIAIRPFEIGSISVAILVMNFILMRDGYCAASMLNTTKGEVLNAIYRAVYYDEQSCRPFYELIAKCVIAAQEEQLKLLGANE